MATPQPSSSQPVYQRDLSMALDRSYSHYVVYVDGKFEALSAQMRLGFADALACDEALLKRIEAVEATQQTIIEIQRQTIAALQDLRQEVRALQQAMDKGFATLEEKINEMAARITKLEGGSPPNPDA